MSPTLIMIQKWVDLEVKYVDLIPLHCDNIDIISMSKNPVLHSKTKKIPIKYHFLREKVTNKVVQLNFIPSTKHIADIFTKPLPKTQFEYLHHKLGIISYSK